MTAIATPPASPSEIRPIRLVSKYAGLQVRVKAGVAERIPNTDRYETKPGSWLEFRAHQAVLPAKRILTLWGSRAAAVDWLKSHPRYRTDFWINDDKDTGRAKPAASPETVTE